MTARDDLFAAARSLASRGVIRFSPAELLEEARNLGSTYPDQTLRTMIAGSHLRLADGAMGPGFRKLGPRLYGFADGDVVVPSRSEPLPPGAAIAAGPALAPNNEWFWEGRVQAIVVRWLATNGWEIRRVADTASREQGVDIEAWAEGRKLLVEVKGYPSSVYARGENAGQIKRTTAPTQARVWFSGALLSGVLMRADHPDAGVVLAFPDVPTFRTLASRTSSVLRPVGVDLWLVTESGQVHSVST